MDYLIHLVILVSITAILGMSLNLVVGFTGLLSVAHAAFFGIGAYATALLMTTAGMNFFSAMLSGVLIACGVSLGMGFVLSRFRDDYYALGSLGLNVIIFSILLNWQEFTRGPLGIPGIGRPSLGSLTFTDNVFFMILALFVVCGVWFMSHQLMKSSYGRVLRAIREDEQALEMFGTRAYWFKLSIYMFSAACASVAGSLFASYISYIDPFSFTINESIFLLTLIILGGLASLRGSVIGAIVLVLLPEVLRFVGFPHEIAAQMRQLIYGLLLVFLVLYRPQGLMGEYKL